MNRAFDSNIAIFSLGALAGYAIGHYGDWGLLAGALIYGLAPWVIIRP